MGNFVITLAEQTAKYAKTLGKTSILETNQSIFSKKILHLSKSHFMEIEDLTRFFEQNQNAERRIGSLPYEWIESFKKTEIAEVTKKVDNIFKNYAERIKCYMLENHKNYEDMETYNDELAQELKIILKRDDISIEYTGHGVFKYCQKIKVGKHSYALSTFKEPNYVGNDYGIHQGYMYEQQNAFAAYKQGAHGRIAKPFMARTCRNEDKDGYILAQFLDDSKSKVRKGPLETRYENICYGDDGAKNYTNNIIHDFGGIFKNNIKFQDKQERSLMLRFVKILENYSSNIVTESYLLDKISQGKDITSKDFFETINIKDLMKLHMLQDATLNKTLYHKIISKLEPHSKSYNIVQKIFSKSSVNYEKEAQNDIKCIKKQIKAINKLIEIKKQLELNGTWEKDNELLNKDLAYLFPVTSDKPFHKENYRWITEKSNIFPESVSKIIGIDNTPKTFSTYMQSFHEYFADVVDANIAEKYSKKEVLEYLQANKLIIPDERIKDIANWYPNIIKFKKAFNFTDEEMSSMISVLK